jgi:NADPH:quinone reductase-like Zn-dependent oxidoreductase
VLDLGVGTRYREGMARVVRFHEFGGPEVLRLEELETPSPRIGEVRIAVKALGLNRAESMFRSGQYNELPVFPSRIGYEAAGVVDAIGEGVSECAPGDSVSVVPSDGSIGKYGTYGEYAIVPERYLVKHPSSLSFVDAAAVWMQYLTAYGALIEIGNLTKDDFVVIPAASSSVGLAAIQIANLVGATPIATTRTASKRDALLAAGAPHVIVTDEEPLADRIRELTEGAGARVVFDPVAGPGLHALVEGTAFGGIVILYGALSPEPTPLPLFPALLGALNIRGYRLFEITEVPERLARAKRFVLDGLASGQLKPILAKTFALDRIVDATRFLESNQQFGKVIVTV